MRLHLYIATLGPLLSGLPATWAAPSLAKRQGSETRAKDFDWPEVFEVDGRTNLEGLKQTSGAYFNSPEFSSIVDVDDYWALWPKGSMFVFWNTLLAILKCNSEGEWIKSMFDSVSRDEKKATVILYHGVDDEGDPQGYTTTVSLQDVPGYNDVSDFPWWPMFIAKAILDSPQKGDIQNPEKLLTMLTGYKAQTLERPSKDEINQAVELANTSPVLYSYTAYGVSWWEVLVTVELESGFVKFGTVDPFFESPVIATSMTVEEYFTGISDPDSITGPDSIVYLKDPRFTHFDGGPRGALKTDPPPE